MAEAWTRVLLGDVFEPHSAGIVAHGLDRDAVKVMGEVGVDISDRRSKTVDDFLGLAFDYVVTLSARARVRLPYAWCPSLALHAGFAAPRRRQAECLGADDGLDEYRCVREAIRVFVERLPYGDPHLLLVATANGEASGCLRGPGAYAQDVRLIETEGR